MPTIYYDAWDDTYKHPFGAIELNHTVQFTVKVVTTHATEVKLVMVKDGESSKKYLDMIKVSHDTYQLTFTCDNGVGLYFYYFQIIEQIPEKMPHYQFLGCGKTGKGVISADENQLEKFQLTCYQKKDVAPNWYREAIFYQIFPDRFYNGNPQQIVNAPKANSFLYGQKTDQPMYIKNQQGEVIRWDFFGGNLQGIIQKIPYLKELGITALYLNPIFAASSNHRYDTNDYLKIDSMLGTEADFKQLVKALHAENMHLVLDGVFSHVGKNSRYFNQANLYENAQGAANSKQSRYYSWFNFTDYPHDYASWWGIKDLPVVDKENKAYQQFIYGADDSVVAKWTRMGVDGWRLDVADELPDAFIEGIRQRLVEFPETVLIGEVWEDATNKIAYDKRRRYTYGGNLQSVMNYPLRTAILDFVNGENRAEVFCQTFTRLQENYPPDFFNQLFNNLGTHDTERLLTAVNENVAKRDLAQLILCFLPGVPCFYYGDEVGVLGGTDPENRSFFPWEVVADHTSRPLKAWLKLRKKTPVLTSGDCVVFSLNHCLVIARYDQQTVKLLVVNNSEQAVVLTDEVVAYRKLAPVVLAKLATLSGQKIEANSYLFQ